MNIDFVIPSYKSEELTTCAIQSFEKYKGDFNFQYIVVENSDDTSYREALLKHNNVLWIQNPISFRTSEANAHSLQTGLQYVKTEYVFLCHNDVVACHPEWMKHLYSKIEEGAVMSGTVKDPTRIKAIHISGVLLQADIAKRVKMFPHYKGDKMMLDCGDLLTVHCDLHQLKYTCCKNTFNTPEIIANIDRFKSFLVDRAVNDKNEVIYMHLGRGDEKRKGTYNKPNRVYHNEWIDFIKENVL
jgi:glycosyltransferase involved in cell wall biosynthesis